MNFLSKTLIRFNIPKVSIVILIFLQICCQLSAQSRFHSNPTPRIINGTAASVNQTKYQVSIRLKKHEATFGNGHICGGSLIGSNKVLTAAHCLYNADQKRFRKAKEFVVVMGTLNRYQRVNGTIVSDVKSIAYMNTFNLATMRDDVGVMFLKTGLPPNRTHLTIEPIQISNETTASGATCRVSGWGTTEKGSLSSILLMANVTIIERRVCRVSYGPDLLVGMTCAGQLKGGTDSCQGDSGGPLVHNNKQVGIVSWGTGCGQPGYPGVYADVPYYYSWIMSRSGALNLRGSCSMLLGVLLTLSAALYH